jgi:hypothetical protein
VGLQAHSNGMHEGPALLLGSPRILNFPLLHGFNCLTLQVAGIARLAQARSDGGDDDVRLIVTDLSKLASGEEEYKLRDAVTEVVSASRWGSRLNFSEHDVWKLANVRNHPLPFFHICRSFVVERSQYPPCTRFWKLNKHMAS